MTTGAAATGAGDGPVTGTIGSGLWRDLEEVPEALARTLQAADGFGEAAALLAGEHVRRIVATGNGAAYYVAHALWLASVYSGANSPPVVAAPAGLVAQGRFPWRPGDVLVAISSSGEFRDVVEAIEAGAPRPYVAVTASPESRVGAGAGGRACYTVLHQRAPTHTQVVCGGTATALALWGRASADRALLSAVDRLPELAAAAVARARSWMEDETALAAVPARPRAAVAFGSGSAWSGALEAALLLKEVAGIPAEGVETREAATSSMYALGAEDLVVSLPSDDRDPLLVEAEGICAQTGAAVVRAPVPVCPDARVAPAVTLPAGVALAVRLAAGAGLDVDHPPWVDSYHRTARAGRAPDPS